MFLIALYTKTNLGLFFVLTAQTTICYRSILSIANTKKSIVMQSILNRFYDFLYHESQECEFAIPLIGLLCFSGYLLFYIISQPNYYESLYLILSAIVVSPPLILYKRWPAKLVFLRSIYWYFAIIFLLPFSFTYMMLNNQFMIEWQYIFIAMVVLLLMIVQWFSLVLILLCGVITGYLTYLLVNNFAVDSSYNYSVIVISLYVVPYSLFLYGVRKLRSKQEQSLIKQLNHVNSLYTEKCFKIETTLARQMNMFNEISHEIRGPVHGIIGISEMLDKNWNIISNEEKLQKIHTISETADKLKLFINSLLDISRFKTGNISLSCKIFDLKELINDTLLDCKKLYVDNKKININFKSSIDHEAYIYADELKVSQLITNLVTNAIKYTAIGEIIVKLDLSNFEDIECWKFSIIDRGIGINDEELGHIFEPFFRGAKAGNLASGSGLGLAISKEIIKAHNGHIWAEKARIGAKICFTIPTIKEIHNNI